MAFDKAVDSAQLDAGLTTLANAIRTKGGTMEPLDFPQGMAAAVAAISGGDKNEAYKNLLLRIEGKAFDVKITDTLTIAYEAFRQDASLTNFTSGDLVKIDSNAFYKATALRTFTCGSVGNVEFNAFWISGLNKADFGAALYFGPSAFKGTNLETLIIRNGLTKLNNANVFFETPIASGTGYIYVPKALVEEYKAATNWTTYAAQIRAIEDYPEITGGTV